MHLLILSMLAHLTKELGMVPGGEFRTAYQEAQKLSGCIIKLGERPINITLKRAMGSPGPWQKLMKLVWNILSNSDPITKERCTAHLDTESTTDGGQARLNASRPIRFQQSSQ